MFHRLVHTSQTNLKFVPLQICSFVLSTDATSEKPKLINCVRNYKTISERTRQRLLWTKRHKTSSNSVASSHYQRLYPPHYLVRRTLQDAELALLPDSWKYFNSKMWCLTKIYSGARCRNLPNPIDRRSKFCYFLVFFRWWRISQLPAENDTSVKRCSQSL
jgi:hypothetical protein